MLRKALGCVYKQRLQSCYTGLVFIAEQNFDRTIGGWTGHECLCIHSLHEVFWCPKDSCAVSEWRNVDELVEFIVFFFFLLLGNIKITVKACTVSETVSLYYPISVCVGSENFVNRLVRLVQRHARTENKVSEVRVLVVQWGQDFCWRRDRMA